MADAHTKTRKLINCRGMKFPFDRELLPTRVRLMLREQTYEKKEADAALRLIKSDDVVMELGAGIGFMSTLISTQTKAREIHCYEANPTLLPYIREVHELNGVGNVHINHAVLGDSSGTATFYVRQSILDSSLEPLDGDTDEVEQVPVPIQSAQEAMDRIKPTVMVCDIEGAEATLFPKIDFTGLRAVLIELHPQWIRRDGIRTVFRQLDKAGLVFFPRWSTGKVAVFRSDW